MISKDLAPGITVYSNVIPDYESLINEIEASVDFGALQWQQAYVRTSDKNEVNTETRDTFSIGVPYHNSEEIDFSSPTQTAATTLGKLFYESFDPIEKDYKNIHSLVTEWHDVFGILKYGVGQKFVNHIDDHQEYPRRLSTVYYLNDNYEGGEISFPRFNISYKPNANEMILFPSSYVYNHSVSEVTSGTRYAVVSWLR